MNMKTIAPEKHKTGLFRQLRPSDKERFRAHLLRLDQQSRRDRFNGPAGDDFLKAYADRSFASGATVVGYIVDGAVRGAAELHELGEHVPPTAEIAFSVEPSVQHRGVGARLFELLIENARWLGYSCLHVTTHPQNVAMKRLAQRFEADLRFEDGATVGLIQLDPRAPKLPPEAIRLPAPLPGA
jgi:RimJ/RimL family protein N-acetyltransferase